MTRETICGQLVNTPDETKPILHSSYTNEAPQGVYNGERFLESLRDDREIWYQGEKITDVTTHPKFAGMAQSLADIYDMQHDPAHQDVMTYVEDNGLRVSTSYLRPTEKDHLHDHTRVS